MRLVAAALLLATADASPDWCEGTRGAAACAACGGALSPTTCQCWCPETPAQTVLITAAISASLVFMFLL